MPVPSPTEQPLVPLTRLVSVPVRFQGWRAATGPLTVGQLNIARWLADAPHAPAALLDQVFGIPPGTRVADVAECFGVLLCRHEGLRSRYVPGEPGEQRVLTAGELQMAVYEAGDGEPAERVAARIVELTRAEPLDVKVDPPVRLAVAIRHGIVLTAVAVYSHLAVDFQALVVLDHEFAEMIREPKARVLGEARQQPLDRATVERQPGKRRRLDQALRYWSRHLAAAPVHLYAKPRVHHATGSGACGMTSERAARALDRIAARTQVSRPTIVLAALSVLLSHRTGYGTCQFVMLSANRFESSLQRYVGTLAQSTYVSVEVGDAGFDELVRRCFGAVLQAGLHGAYDVYRQHDHAAWVATERGVAPSFEPLFNSVVVDTRGFDPVPYSGTAAETHLEWADLPPTDILLRFDLGRVEGALVARVWSGDTGRVTPDEARDLLLALERLLVAAADGDLGHDAAVTVTGLAPIERPPGWLLVDNCWVDLADIQCLLDEALAPAVSRVFADAAGDPLVAYVAGDVSTPAEVHRRCLARLPGRHAAMTPRRYVICQRAPENVASLEAWRDQPILASGTGRK
ncbi:condensation domain-containing protein [Dactylosporangium sp. NPDC005572]|uniref:condensation domain-containing protein n=1 Tax=Dactylosporangium sp. NPDC005572 TaxID=3156889 RepID=UPI0033BAE109